MKICNICCTSKDDGDFEIDGVKGTLRNACKDCRNLKWKNKRRNNPNYSKFYHTLKKYGLDDAGYKALFIRQEGKCKICERTDTYLTVDHNHKTGAVRGLLCQNCNSIIGHAGDDINILHKSIEYLIGDKSKTTLQQELFKLMRK